MLKQMRLKSILPAFAVKQSSFSSISMWKLLFKKSNINPKQFVKKQNPTTKQEAGGKKRFKSVCKFKKANQKFIIRHFYLATEPWLWAAAAEQAVLGESSQCSASCSSGTDSSGMCMAQPFHLPWPEWMGENKATAAINICMPWAFSSAIGRKCQFFSSLPK